MAAKKSNNGRSGGASKMRAEDLKEWLRGAEEEERTRRKGEEGLEGAGDRCPCQALRAHLAHGRDPAGRFFSYNARPPYKMGHQVKFWVHQLLGHKIGLLGCPRPILGLMSPF